MSDSTNLTVFVDGIGRTIVGEVLKETKTALNVKNPAIVHVQPNAQTGQISVQLIPFFFKEFLKGQSDTEWQFLKATLTVATDLVLEERLVTQYTNMYSVVQAPGQPAVVTPGDAATKADAPVIKLFDD